MAHSLISAYWLKFLVGKEKSFCIVHHIKKDQCDSEKHFLNSFVIEGEQPSTVQMCPDVSF